MAYRNTTPSAEWWASATCATTGSRTAWRPRASLPARKARSHRDRKRRRSGADYFGVECARSAVAPTTASRPRASPCRQPAARHRPRGYARVAPEHPHWPLVFMLVLTQLAVGAFAMLWLLDLLARRRRPCALGGRVAGARRPSLGASTLHLGRPIHAWRALKGLRTSWLSREVLQPRALRRSRRMFSAMLLFDMPGRTVAGAATASSARSASLASARIYMVRARPAWNSATRSPSSSPPRCCWARCSSARSASQRPVTRGLPPRSADCASLSRRR